MQPTYVNADCGPVDGSYVYVMVSVPNAEVEALGGGRWDTSSLLARLEAAGS